MALYDIVTNNPAVASDVEQLVNIFNGKHDIGSISLAPSLSTPSSSSFGLTAQSGSSLGAGTYNYQFTYVTGQYKSDGITLVSTGETLPTSALSITTTAGNTNVSITLPSSLPNSVIAINIYRTSVGGSDYKLVATVKAGSASYVDSTTDGNRGTQTPSTSNNTGTRIIANLEVLWTGGYYMSDSQSINPTRRLDQCPNGWILVWSDYTSGTTNDYDFNYTIISKYHGYAFPSTSVWFPIVTDNGVFATKKMYINNQTITGVASNASGNNANTVLRAVLSF